MVDERVGWTAWLACSKKLKPWDVEAVLGHWEYDPINDSPPSGVCRWPRVGSE